MNLFKRETSTVGLDIGSHSIKLVKLRHARSGDYILEAMGKWDLKPGVVENGEIKNKESLKEAITTLVNQCDPSIVDVVISMSGNAMLSEKFTFNIDHNDNTEETILWEASQKSPFDVDDITLDYKILKEFPEKNQIEVLLVAAKNQIMQNYIDLLYEVGLRPVIVDVETFALYNCVSLETTADAAHEGVTALLNIGHNHTNVTFFKDGIYHSSRDMNTAGSFFAKTVSRQLSVTEEAAADMIRGKGDVPDKALLAKSLEYAAEEISSFVDLAFSYFRSTEKSDKIDQIVLSGGGAYLPGLTKLLSERHNTSVRISNPLAHLVYDPGLFRGIDPRTVSGFMTIAIGLALRKAV